MYRSVTASLQLQFFQEMSKPGIQGEEQPPRIPGPAFPFPKATWARGVNSATRGTVETTIITIIRARVRTRANPIQPEHPRARPRAKATMKIPVIKAKARGRATATPAATPTTATQGATRATAKPRATPTTAAPRARERINRFSGNWDNAFQTTGSAGHILRRMLLIFVDAGVVER